MIKKKMAVIGSVLAISITLAVVSCSNDKTEAQGRFIEVSFLPAAFVELNDTLSADTGEDFNGSTTTYENDGNENVTTRAGLRVRKSSVISALKNNLGIDSENKITDFPVFAKKINKLLRKNDSLNSADFTDLETVEITIGKNNDATSLFSDLVASSKISPIVKHEISIVFYAKEGKTIGKQKTPRLTLKGMQRIRLSDYRRAGIEDIEVNTNPMLGFLNTIEDSPNIRFVTRVYSEILDISTKDRASFEGEQFDTPLFPIWNEKDDGSPAFTFTVDSLKFPVKRSLSEEQMNIVEKLIKIKNPQLKYWIWGAVEKVWFTNSAGNIATTPLKRLRTVRTTQEGNIIYEYEGTMNLNINLIQYWSWGSTPHSPYVKTATFPITFKIQIPSYEKQITVLDPTPPTRPT